MDEREIDCAIDVVHQAAIAGIDFTDEDWRQHPLFRLDPPADIEHDRHFSCFQHLLYEGQTPDSLALQFKEFGNERYQAGRAQWHLAAYWWTRALQEGPTDTKLRSVLHANRAAVSLGLQQYQRAAVDADWAVRLDASNAKAYVRAAHAYQGMARWDEALSTARAGLAAIAEGDPARAPLEKVVATVSEEIAAVDRRVATYFDALAACDGFFRREKVAVGQFAHAWMGNWELALRFDEDKGETIWPVIVVYDEVLQADFVEGFGERAPLTGILALMIPGEGADPPQWDTEGRYSAGKIVLYVAEKAVEPRWGVTEVRGEPGNVEVDPECCLRDLFGQPGYVVPGYPVLGIAVRASKFARGLGIKEKITKNGRIAIPKRGSTASKPPA
jgi:hypothetical protein